NLKDDNGNVIATTTTLADGSYEFTGLTPGDYSVQFVLPLGSEYSPLNASGDEATDSDADPAMSGMTEVVTLVSGQTNDDLDAGLYEPASIGDFVWLDEDGDGVQDDGEDGVEGVTVNLKDENGKVIASTTTEADGSYEFTDLTPGDYSVQFVLPANNTFSPLNASGDEANDSDADPSMSGMTEVVTLTSGQTNDDLDAGINSIADLNLVKRVDEIFPNVGDIVTFSIIVENDGPNTATGVGVRDSIPNGYNSIDNISDGGMLTDDIMNWTGISIPAGEKITLTFTAEVLPPGENVDYVNIARVEESDQFDPDSEPGNVADTDGDGIIGSEDFDGRKDDDDEDDGDEAWVEPQIADLSLIKSVSNTTPFVGETVTFTISMTNSGPSNATGVDVSDLVPDGYSSISNISDGGILSGSTITWSNLEVNALSTKDLTFTATVEANGNYVNVAQIDAADQFDPDSEPGNPADSNPGGGIGSEDDDGTQDPNDEDDGDDAVVNPLTASVNIEKLTNGFDSDIAPGQLILFLNGTEKPVEWTYQVTNNGSSDLVNLEVVDNIEGDVCVIDELKVGETIECKLTGITKEGMYANVATVTGTPVNPNTGEPTDLTVMDDDPSHYAGVRFNIEQTVSDNLVCPGEEVDVMVAIRLFPTGDPEIDENIEFRNVRFNSEGLMEVLDVNSIYFDENSDPNDDGILTPDEFEFVWNYSLEITENSKYMVTDTFDVFFNDVFVDMMTAKDSIMVDVSEEECSQLGDLVWFDEDADGIKDDNEDGINGITVNLYVDSDKNGEPDNPGMPIETTTTMLNLNTGNNGYYQFTGLIPDGYVVEFVDPSGNYLFSPQDEGADETADSDADPATGFTNNIMLMTGDSNQDVDAGLFLPAFIGNYVWNDENGDGLQGDDENGIPGVTVTLTDENGNEVLDVNGNIVGNETTDGNGEYSFDNLLPGMYIVTFASPDGFIATQQDVLGGTTNTDQGDVDVDSDADPMTGQSHIIDLTAGETDDKIDAGFFEPGSIGDYVWNDEDGDGIQDDDEVGVNGITVNLYTDEDMDGMIEPGQIPLETTSTMNNPIGGSAGFYEFDELPSGKYLVEIEADGYVISNANQGGDDTVDSDIDPNTGVSDMIELGPGEDNNTIDAGIYIGGSIGDLVWNDASGLIADVYEPGIDVGVSGVVVNLLQQQDPLDPNSFVQISTTNTNTNGGYLFEDLPAGNYQVEFILPVGQAFVQPNVGDDNFDSDADPATGLTGVIVLPAGGEDLSNDAGLTLPAVPVELISFTGKWNEERNFTELEWSTATEIDNDYFEIERSFGTTNNFAKIGVVAGNGTTFETQEYGFDDRNIESNGIYFYRLRQLDYDGTFAYSDIIAIRVEREADTEIEIYPNPTIEYFNIDVKTDKQRDITVRLFDMSGKLVSSRYVQAGDVQYENIIRIDVSDLPAGLYNVRTEVGKELFVQQIDVIK
ncbi:SdrD B-like domain-containing protein, partial [Portibacter marinus]|uniref:SdrD B-like domain-containing protein n=1 Tax=Portibacter marinus TaxID=2898660 RepID=UPI001F46A25B